MTTKTEQQTRYWLTAKGWAATEPSESTCRAIRGCTQPATGTALSYAALGYVPACTDHRQETR